MDRWRRLAPFDFLTPGAMHRSGTIRRDLSYQSEAGQLPSRSGLATSPRSLASDRGLFSCGASLGCCREAASLARLATCAASQSGGRGSTVHRRGRLHPGSTVQDAFRRRNSIGLLYGFHSINSYICRNKRQNRAVCCRTPRYHTSYRLDGV